MSTVVSSIIVALVGCLFGALVTYFVTTISSRKSIEDMAYGVVRQHIKEFHKDDPWKIVEKHETECPAPPAVKRIERGVLFVVMKLGGNPSELGLVE